MGFPRDEGQPIKIIKARVSHGDCILCREPIRPGDEYIGGVGGSRIRLCGKAHWRCYNAPASRSNSTTRTE